LDLLHGNTAARLLEQALSSPLRVGSKVVRYRFARQKAQYLADALPHIDSLSELSGVALRDALCSLRGIGPKTASWIARNWCDADDVAILDIHICRACERAGVFAPGSNPQRHYHSLEVQFLSFARALRVRSSVLDNLMWNEMRHLSPALDR
jgi:thermostable 8-oxoguanine DNA glycosylase